MASIPSQRECKKSSRQRGMEGESRALDYISQQGLSVLARNVRGPQGEIDIIATNGEELIFFEVKSWAVWDHGDLSQAIDRRKQEKIIETAKFFLAQHREYSNMAYRFDVLLLGPSGIHHLAHAFMERV